MSDQSAFLEVWYNTMIIAGIGSFTISFVIYLVHNFRIAVIKEFKAKYDYILIHEIKAYKKAFIGVGVGIGCLITFIVKKPQLLHFRAAK